MFPNSEGGDAPAEERERGGGGGQQRPTAHGMGGRVQRGKENERERERERENEREGYRAHGPEGWVTGTYGREGIVNRIQSKF
jgi:hypothetical protein